MNNDPTARSAKRLATAIAIPVAVVAGFVAFQVLEPAPVPRAAPPSPTPSRIMATSPVDVPVRVLPEGHTAMCKTLMAALPDQLRDWPRRPVTGDTQQSAAYGEPAVLVNCGVSAATYPPDDRVYSVNGACWHADKTGSLWRTVDRMITVAVVLPPSQAGSGSGQWATALSPAIAASIPPATTIPFGCTG